MHVNCHKMKRTIFDGKIRENNEPINTISEHHCPSNHLEHILKDITSDACSLNSINFILGA
uniref:Uncharacterized protein LOC105141716 isoform X1 n=1 Tax=Rhizophora mucronata TaxID=61149 RepID=A0A2P2KF93_RHIMU